MYQVYYVYATQAPIFIRAFNDKDDAYDYMDAQLEELDDRDPDEDFILYDAELNIWQPDDR